MKSKAPVVIGVVFTIYVIFVAITMMFYEPKIEDMDWEDRQSFNQQNLTHLNLGQHIDSIRARFGAADFSEAKHSNGKPMHVLFYRTHKGKSDGKTTKDECTPLLFIDNKLVAWGTDTYQQYIESEITL
ncbi:DUF3192 domain-containing protein [Parashewanella spongiae]|uniref:DUF3192 domain-containing protein n=1 Tax=Parashewanella spongiae TaxID=342950 RepID=A0A3A6TTK8_9GAMM|nr:DUF3192 domain-containing protein [Parashewanella spongiae]MCL1077911.1 DUF3192 domain-containing protein [Parashewanella spongiae]RJY17555.1 DUF3192 domain-containing protein [Parashewanella spongiae]